VKRSLIFIFLVIVVITAILFAGQYFSRNGKSAALAAVFKPADEGPAIGGPAPDFKLKALAVASAKPDPEVIQLSQLKGKAVIVNFWATWCGPCKIEMPWLVDLQKKYGPQGLQIVGVAMDDSDEKTISEFAQKMGVNYPIAKGSEKIAEAWGGLDGLPYNFFVDRNGKVVASMKGLDSESVIVANIEKALGGAHDHEHAASTAAR
jgi:thiol-disulfide isomerase/thioredoxin